MTLTIEIAMENLKNILKEKAPVRRAYEKNGRVYNGGPVGKPGTNMYSPYPGNLKNNGIYPGYRTPDKGTIVLSGVDGKVGYLPYTNAKGKHQGWIESGVQSFVNWLCSTYGGKRY